VRCMIGKRRIRRSGAKTRLLGLVERANWGGLAAATVGIAAEAAPKLGRMARMASLMRMRRGKSTALLT
jgi:hypothetical protein